MRVRASLRRAGALMMTVAAALTAPSAHAAAPSPSPARPAVEALARQLAAAVGRVSPSAQTLTGGPDTTQALHVVGIGVVIVLPARALPQQRRQLSVRSRAREESEAPLPPAPPERVVNLPPSPAPRALEQLERELEREMALRAQLMRAIERAQRGDDAVLRRALELQMLAIREQAEIFRIEVERQRARAEREVRIRLDAIGRAPAPEAAAAPAAPAAVTGSEAPVGSGPAAAAEPPWRVWMGAPPVVAQAHQAMVEQVREALIGGLEAHGEGLRVLAPEESVTVAVDFVGAGPFGMRPKVRGTLVVRAGVADLLARAAGRLGPAEFRQRLQARQY